MAEIMTKFINDPQHITQELLEGYVLAYPDQVKLAAENIVVRTHPKSCLLYTSDAADEH